MDFLDGKSDYIVRGIEQRMAAAAADLDFERAADYRDQLRAIERITARQRIIGPDDTDQDVIAFARDVYKRQDQHRLAGAGADSARREGRPYR